MMNRVPAPPPYVLPRGSYFADDVGRLAGVSGDRIGQWARWGYIQSSRSTGTPRIYSFQDVGEAMAVHELIKRGVDQAVILKTTRALREEHGDWPLQSTTFYLPDGPARRQRQLAYRRGGALVDSAGRTMHQQILSVGKLKRLALELHKGGWATRDVPGLRSIIVDPDVMSGRPAIRGRRIAVADVVEIASEPDGEHVLIADYDLTAKQIADARAWWIASERYQLPIAA